MLAAVLVGIFHFDPADVVNLGIRYLALAAAASIFSAAAALTVLVVWFVKKYLLGK